MEFKRKGTENANEFWLKVFGKLHIVMQTDANGGPYFEINIINENY